MDDFGEGFNAGLSLGVVKELASFNLGLTGAYIFKGAYDPTKELADDDVDPGDQAVVSAVLNWKVASGIEVETIMTYSHFWAKKTDGMDSYQDGGKMAFGGHVRAHHQSVDHIQETW